MNMKEWIKILKIKFQTTKIKLSNLLQLLKQIWLISINYKVIIKNNIKNIKNLDKDLKLN